MNKRQKIFVTTVAIIILALLFIPTLLSPQMKTESNKLKIVATFYPLAFFANQIGGNEVTIKQLIPDNMEVHNWQPSLADILALEEADVIIYNGASLDHWFKEDVLPILDLTNKIIVETINENEILKTEQENNGYEHDQEHKGFCDPHTWISPFLAKLQSQNIYEALIKKDENNRSYYTKRWKNLNVRFEQLDRNYFNTLSNKLKKKIFVAHSAFGYLAGRYGFEQHGVIGLAADEQPSASTYTDLVEKMIDHQTYVIYVNPVYPHETTRTLKNELERLSGQDVDILKLYFMLGDIEGLDYFGQQEKNLESLKIGLEAQ
jgi:zinc transport system substrate-binding protein